MAQRVLIHQRTAGDVHQVDPGPDEGQGLGIEHLAGLVGGGRRQHEVVGRRDQLAERVVMATPSTGLGRSRRRMATTDMSRASATRATRWAMPPKP